MRGAYNACIEAARKFVVVVLDGRDPEVAPEKRAALLDDGFDASQDTAWATAIPRGHHAAFIFEQMDLVATFQANGAMDLEEFSCEALLMGEHAMRRIVPSLWDHLATHYRNPQRVSNPPLMAQVEGSGDRG